MVPQFLIIVFLLISIHTYIQTRGLLSTTDIRSPGGVRSNERKRKRALGIERLDADDFSISHNNDNDCDEEYTNRNILGDDGFGNLGYVSHDDSFGCDEDEYRFNDDAFTGFMDSAGSSTKGEDDFLSSSHLMDDVSSFDDDAFIDDELTQTLVDATDAEIPPSNFFEEFEMTDDDGQPKTDAAAMKFMQEFGILFAGEGDFSSQEVENRVQARIVGGTIAGGRRYPYIVSLLNVFPAPGGLRAFHVCGGSLIAPDVVLSAAHCVTSKLQYAQLGKYHKHANHNKPHTVETMKIVKVVMHPEWNDRAFMYDLVLLKLETKTQRMNNVLKIQTQDDMIDGEPVQVMGWGKTRAGGRMSSLLRHVTVNIMSNQKCMSDMYGYGSVIKEMMMCANNGPADACQGDSGGPMVRQDPNDLENPDKDIQVGIVSWGFGCSFARYPGVYARIQFDWIQETVCRPETGMSPDSCAGPNLLYANDPMVSNAASGVDMDSGQSATCVDKTTTFPSTMMSNVTCDLVAKHISALCYYHRDDCPKTCCPDDCDLDSGKCVGDPSTLP